MAAGTGPHNSRVTHPASLPSAPVHQSRPNPPTFALLICLLFWLSNSTNSRIGGNKTGIRGAQM